MKLNLSFFILINLSTIPSFGQDTFSIVANDSITREVGSAGASCISGSIIISDVHPGVGAIHTQSYWNAANQNNASSLMDQGYSPQGIIDWLVENDAQDNPSIRQYGIIDMVNGGRSAGYTGENCFDYKNHILGPTYAIQGNILLGQEVLDNMEANFLNNDGPLTHKLMAALQGTNIPGADTRCLSYGTSSLSAFIRLAKSGDNEDSLYLNLNVNTVIPGVEPIDSLQILFDAWVLEQTPFTAGDVTEDSVIDILDIVLMINIITGMYDPSTSQFLASDLNGDGTIGVMDVVQLVSLIINYYT